MDSITLYKYRTIGDRSLDTLRSNKMWFSAPANFNDTFEFSVPSFISISPTELVEHFEKRFKMNDVAPTLLDAMMKHGGSDKFEVSDKFLDSFLRSNKEDNSLYVIALIHFLREQGLTTEDIIEKLNLHRENGLCQRLEIELRKAYHQNQSIGHDCGVLSLSTSNNDPLLWAHYANSCQGMCIGITFNIDELIETDFIPLWVEYAEELPVLNPSHFFNRDKTNVMDMLKTFYATKHVAWKHESEFRLISKKGNFAYKVPGKITEIILGEKINDFDAQNVLNAIQGKSGTTLLKMMREPGTWNYRAYGSSI